MQQFIPFEDDWDALARSSAGRLVPYQLQFNDRAVDTAPAEGPRRLDDHGLPPWPRVANV